MAGNLIPCKHCNKEVAKGAKVCPSCGGTLKMGWAKKILILFGGLIALGVISAAMDDGKGSKSSSSGSSSSSSGSSSSSSASASTAPAKVLPKVGTLLKSGDIEATVTKVEVLNQVGSSMFVTKPAEGGTFVAVQWKYKNISTKPISSFSLPSLKLLDPNGVKYDPDLDATSSYATQAELTHKVLSDLNPGITVTDAEVYEVAKSSFKKDSWKLLLKADENIQISLQ